jgi:uncharacterized protein
VKIAIVGSGIAGNTAAWLLHRRHDVTVFEAASYAGGHTNTVDIQSSAGPLAIDTGFIVFNDRTYPEFNKVLNAIGQQWQPSVMSFSVQHGAGRLEYNGASLATMFAQKRNLARPSFWRMLRDILRFNKEAADVLDTGDTGQTLADYLQQHRYSREFAEHYLVPMAAAIWSGEHAQIRQMSIYFLVRFFLHHGLLQLRDRPNWRVIRGGSREYVRRLTAGFKENVRLNCAVKSIVRSPNGINLHSQAAAIERFDAVVIACHSDQALALLRDPTDAERDVLGAIPYQRNEAVLHTDRRMLPQRKACWAAWNYHLPDEAEGAATVTYNMNILQGLAVPEQYLVTLNNSDRIDPRRVLRRFEYDHPVFTRESLAAQARQAELNAGGRTLFCGAYWRNGFHEDGVVSAITAVGHFEEALRDGQLHLRRAG